MIATLRLSALTVAMLLATGGQAAERRLEPGQGFTVRSDDGDFRWQLGGRVHLDSARFDSDSTPLADDTDLRRARVEFGARFHDWRVNADYDVAGVVTGWKSLNAQYRGLDEFRLTFGSQLVPFSMDELTGSDDLSFLERALPNALSPGILTGVSFQTVGRHYSLTGGLYGNSLDNDQRRDADGRSLAFRFTTAPVRRDKLVVHFGVSTEQRDIDNGVVRVRTRTESYLTSARFVDTGRISDASDLTTIGLEFGTKIGPFSLRAEHITTDIARMGLGNVQLDGDYATVGFVLTGESLDYNRRSGTFGGIEPNHRFGAIELVARTSRLDLNDADIVGGIEQNRAIGINWYLGKRVRLMADRVEIDAEPNRDGVTEHPSITELRFQVRL